MTYLILAILTSASIIITFRIFKFYDISLVQAITVNYLVASGFGFLSESGSFNLIALPGQKWFWIAVFMGLSLIVAFNLFALSAQKAGVAVTAISSRMSVVLPVTFGFLLFGDSAGILKIAGIVLGLIAFYFTSKKEKKVSLNAKYVLLPILLFLAVGANDTLMKFAEHYYITTDFVAFLATSFGFALLFGILVLLFKNKKSKEKIHFKNIVAGVILGLLNWFSTYYFLKGLDVFQVSFFIPVFNMGVVALSALVGYIVFKEKLSKTNWIGILLAMIAILLIANTNF